MTKIWGKAFWGTPHEEGPQDGERHLPTGARVSFFLPMTTLALLSVTMGLLAQPLFSLALRAAEQLLNPGGYILAVLGGGG